MTRVIIAAYGDNSRWEELDRPKHLIELDNEVLLYRIVRQVSEYTDDIWVSGNPDPRYKCEKSHLFVPIQTPDIGSIGFLYNNIDIWDEHERTVTLFGDCYYDDIDMEIIMTDNRQELMTYGRRIGNKLTKKPFGEGYAHSFYPEHHLELIYAMEYCISEYQNNRWPRLLGWELQCIYDGVEDYAYHDFKRWTEIAVDTWTEDFDRQEDLDNWLAGRREYKLV